MPMSLLTREVMRRSNHEGKTSEAHEKKTRGEYFFLAHMSLWKGKSQN